MDFRFFCVYEQVLFKEKENEIVCWVQIDILSRIVFFKKIKTTKFERKFDSVLCF